MKITEKLKGRLQSAKSADEVQTILKEVKKGTEEAGVILSDDDLDQASGGDDNPPFPAPVEKAPILTHYHGDGTFRHPQ